MFSELESILKTKAGQEIAELLKDAGFIDVKKDGNEITEIKNKPSYANIIDEAGLPTYCSVSGTTGEIVSVLYHTLKDTDIKPKLDSVFENLLKIAGNKDPEPKDFDFSTYFAPVATFMEVGHFHTTAEVLGGFYSVAAANNKEDTSDDGFRNLLKYFNNHQSDFLGKSPGVSLNPAGN